MRKHEKFILLYAYYCAVHHAKDEHKRMEHPAEHTVINYRAYSAWASLLEWLVDRFYMPIEDTPDAREMKSTMNDVKKLAEDDVDSGKWTSKKTLFNEFERECLEDDDRNWTRRRRVSDMEEGR